MLYRSILGVDGVGLPPDPIQAEPTLEAARAAFEALPPVRVLFDNGGVSAGTPVPAFERSYPRWPVPGTTARSFHLAAGGALADAEPPAGEDRFTWNPRARPATDFRGDTGAGTNGLWTATPSYDWRPNPPGTAAAYTTAPLTADTTVIGGGALRAWIRATVPDVDLQATISEVRPDGRESFVQSGWLRSSARKLDARKSTLLEPIPSLKRADRAPLPRGRFTRVDVPLYYQGHVYRAGSRLRVTVSAPGGDQPIWAFARTHPESGTPTVRIARGGSRPSRLILPVVPGGAAPTPLPPCPGLRGEPCRAAP